MDEIFQAFSDGTRRAMLRDLATGERTVGELCEPFPMTLAAASKHIRVLEKAGLVRREIRWRTHVCHLEATPVKQALEELAFYERFWTSRLDTLEHMLREEDAQTMQPALAEPCEGDQT
ncbi:helix-turn-helix transcriptional regulator [Oceaniovalibus sp. ACAM 378]|uniref:ArsR/SmtB family transcription factor n=1 Tax=Oceaniovalibus sp. ACAM 378 TaxID=2599923 RepID=UPI001CA3284F|nr:metalloregulator ArsR/SmtB family transcription factor [Oceaniovalibus sp. ACAM 378]